MKIHYSIECRADNVEKELFALLRSSGLKRVFLGMESGSQTVLDRFKKDITVEENITAIKILSGFDIYVTIGFIMFDDRTNLSEINENLTFIQKVKDIMPRGRLKNIFIASKLQPWSGTEFEHYLIQAQKYQGDSLDYNYKLNNYKINFLFNFIYFLYSSTGVIRKIRNKEHIWEKQWLL